MPFPDFHIFPGYISTFFRHFEYSFLKSRFLAIIFFDYFLCHTVKIEILN